MRVTIKRDLRGRPVAVGTADEPERFGHFAYDADGTPKAETLAGVKTVECISIGRARLRISGSTIGSICDRITA
jgi:YD repeat-containing protein